MEGNRELSLEEIKKLAVGGCTDIFKNTHRNKSKKSIAAFKQSLEKKTLQQINEIAEKMVRRANVEPKQIKGNIDTSGVAK